MVEGIDTKNLLILASEKKIFHFTFYMFLFYLLYEVLPQDTTHLIQRPCYQQGNPCRDQADNWTTQRPPDHHKEMQTEVIRDMCTIHHVWLNYLAKHSEWGKKTRQTEEGVERQH